MKWTFDVQINFNLVVDVLLSSVLLKSVFIEHLNTSHRLSNNIRQTGKVSQISGTDKSYDSPLYSETTKRGDVFDEQMTIKNKKITKRSYAYKGYGSTHNVKILFTLNYSFKILNLQLKSS